MKNQLNSNKSDKARTRKEILRSAIASFHIEGINISEEQALIALKKVEVKLGKHN